MAHLVRRDWMIQLLAEIARAINWFNPLFWIACARLRRESEYACDDIVLDLGTGGTSYAVASGRSRADVQRARPHLAAGAVHCTSVHA